MHMHVHLFDLGQPLLVKFLMLGVSDHESTLNENDNTNFSCEPTVSGDVNGVTLKTNQMSKNSWRFVEDFYME